MGQQTVDTSFSDMLRKLRIGAGFSQEMLADRAGISVDAVSAYERGLRASPHRSTIALLVKALNLSGSAQTAFEEIAQRRRGTTSSQSAATGPNTNLPWQATSFVGRQREIEEISDLLLPRRLVTVTGTGGIGKTRTSLEVASRIALPPRDGAWLVELAPVTDAALVPSKLAAVLGVSFPEQSGDVLAPLLAAIKSRQLLLILDNCEHVLGAVREVAKAMLQECPQITILATSRERLGVSGEHVYRLSTLPVPDKGAEIPGADRSFPGLELFTERARDHGFPISDEDLGIASDVCRRLNGIALAIELAAARLPVLGLSELRAQLTKHFKIIGRACPDLPVRHRTLNATISWSHDALDDPERILFRRLAVFSRGWTLEAATSVCSDQALREAAVLETLFSLVEKSLVSVDLDHATPRYSFFESTRAYAIEQLTANGEGPAVFRRHAQWVAAFAERTYEVYGGVPRGRWATDIGPEIDNTLTALEWAFGPDGDFILAGRITSALQGFWRTAGLGSHGRLYVNAALQRLRADEHPITVARLLLAQIRFIHGSERMMAMRRAISLVDPTGDRLLLARCYAMLSFALGETGKSSEAEAAHEKAAALLCELGLQSSGLYSNLLSDRSQVLLMLGRLDEARSTLAEALSLAVALADDWSVSACHCILVDIELIAGETRRAEMLATEAIANARRIRNAQIEGDLLDTLACCHLSLGLLDLAGISAREALDFALLNSNTQGVHIAVQHLAAVAALRGQAAKAARLLGYVNEWCRKIDYRRTPSAQKGHDLLVQSLKEQLLEDEMFALAVEGAKLTEGSAIGIATES